MITMNVVVRIMGNGQRVKCGWPLADSPGSKIMVNIGSLHLLIHLTCPIVNTGRISYITIMLQFLSPGTDFTTLKVMFDFL